MLNEMLKVSFKLQFTIYIATIHLLIHAAAYDSGNKHDDHGYHEQSSANYHSHMYRSELQDGTERSVDTSTSSINLPRDPAVSDFYTPYLTPHEHSLAFSNLNSGIRTQLKRQVLNALGIDSRPLSVSNNWTSARVFIDAIYNKFNIKSKGRFVVNPNDATIHLRGNDLETFIAETLSISTQEAINKSDTIVGCANQKLLNTGVLEFDVGPSINGLLGPNTPILAAQLRVFKNRSITNEGSIRKKGPLAVMYKAEGFLPQQASHMDVHSDDYGWLSFDVTEAIQNWAGRRVNGGSAKLRLNLWPKLDETLGSIVDTVDAPLDLQPFLVIYLSTEKSRARPNPSGQLTRSELLRYLEERSEDLGNIVDKSDYRHRRSLKQPNRSQEKPYKNQTRTPIRNPFHEKFCNKVTWNVSFKELKWSDWIIAPDNYEASYCLGECPFPLPPTLNSTNHAIVQMLAHLMDKQIPKPCCAPTKLQPITVLYYDDYSNVVLKEYRNMIVQSCGCL